MNVPERDTEGLEPSMPDAPYIEVQVGGHRADSRRRGVALVDAADAEAVRAYRWSMSCNDYAYRKTRVEGKQLTVLMHRFLLGLGLGVPYVDHINGDTLDNRRANLRVATHAENHQNRHGRPYRGASWNAQRNRWQAKVQLAGKQHHLGYFATQREAAAVAAAFRREHMPFSADAARKAVAA